MLFKFLYSQVLTIVICILSALFCYALLKSSRSRPNQILAVFICAVIGNFLFSVLGTAATTPEASLFWYRISSYMLPLLLGSGYHFLAIYPRRKWIFRKWRPSVLLCYLPVIPFVYSYLDPRLGYISVEVIETGNVVVRHPFQPTVLMIGMAFVIGMIILDFQRSRTQKDSIEYEMYRIIGAGLLVLVIVTLGTYALSFLIGSFIASIVDISFFSLLLIYSYVLLKYQLPNPTSQLVRLVATVLAVIVIASVSIAGLMLARAVMELGDPEVYLTGLLIFGSLMFMFDELRSAFSKLISRLAPMIKSGEFDTYRIEAIYLINCIDGLVMYHHRTNSGSTGADEDADADTVNVIGGMLNVVQQFCKDSMNIDDRDYLRVLRFGSKRILIEHGETVYIVLVGTGEDDGHLLALMRQVLTHMDTTHGDRLKNWDGDMDKLPDFKPFFTPIMSYDAV